MKQIFEKEVKCFKNETSARIEINGHELRKYIGKKVFVKVFVLSRKERKKAKKR